MSHLVALDGFASSLRRHHVERLLSVFPGVLHVEMWDAADGQLIQAVIHAKDDVYKSVILSSLDGLVVLGRTLHACAMHDSPRVAA